MRSAYGYNDRLMARDENVVYDWHGFFRQSLIALHSVAQNDQRLERLIQLQNFEESEFSLSWKDKSH